MVDQNRTVRIVELSAATTGVSNPDLWRAAKLNLGLLGFVTKIGLRIERDFQIEMKTKSYKPGKKEFDALVDPGQGSIWASVKDCDVAHANYFPYRHGAHRGRLIVHCGQAHFQKEYQTW